MDPAATQVIARLRAFHGVVAKHSARNFRSLTINDGAVFYRDLQWHSDEATYDFLARSWRAFREVQEVDQGEGWLGARLVLAAGFRVLGSRRGIDASLTHVRSVIRRLEAKEITAEQAIRFASSDGRHSDVIPQLQANFSFAKSYLAENSSKLPGSNFYVDLTLFEYPNLNWIIMGPATNWAHPKLGLSGEFARVHEIAYSRLRDVPAGLRNGVAVAKALAPSYDVLTALESLER